MTSGAPAGGKRTFFEVSAICLTLFSSVFLLRGSLGLAPADMAELSRTRFDYSSKVVESLASQQADTRAGLVLLLGAFLCQVAAHTDRLKWKPTAAAAVLAGASLIGGLVIADRCAQRSASEAVRILEESPDRGQTTWPSTPEAEQ